VPPPQCPECGQFLRRTVVVSLTADPSPCPRCEAGLVAAMFPEEASVRPPDLGPAGTVPTAAPASPSSLETRGSVRPPDLVPVMVRDEPRDVISGWDVGADPAELERWRVDRPPFPQDAAIVLGAGVMGGLLGALVPERRGRNLALGAAVGAFGAAAVRQVWRLEP
jgi:hypothetical protein